MNLAKAEAERLPMMYTDFAPAMHSTAASNSSLEISSMVLRIFSMSEERTFESTSDSPSCSLVTSILWTEVSRLRISSWRAFCSWG